MSCMIWDHHTCCDPRWLVRYSTSAAHMSGCISPVLLGLQCCSGSTPASAGCLWDRGPITSRWGSLISIPGPVKATRLCTAATILSGLAAGLFKVIAFSYTDDRQNKYSLFFYWGAFGLLHSCLICIVLPCFLLGFLVYDVVRFDCVVLQLIREKVEGGKEEEVEEGWKRLQPTERAEMMIAFRHQRKGGEPAMLLKIPPKENPVVLFCILQLIKYLSENAPR